MIRTFFSRSTRSSSSSSSLLFPNIIFGLRNNQLVSNQSQLIISCKYASTTASKSAPATSSSSSVSSSGSGSSRPTTTSRVYTSRSTTRTAKTAATTSAKTTATESSPDTTTNDIIPVSSTTSPTPTTTKVSTSAAKKNLSSSTPGSTNSYYDIGKLSNGTAASYAFGDGPLEQQQQNQLYENSVHGIESVDWSNSFQGLGLQPFPEKSAEVLTSPINEGDIEIKPEGLIYLPEIKYRRILNRAFGPGGWGLAPRSETLITPKMITREYALIAHGRLVAIARGEQDYFDPSGIPTATEGCKSNAMMRCCKDLGVASELWDPRFIRQFKKKFAHQVFVEYIPTKKTKAIWMRKDDEIIYPYKKT